uniref:Uncharacterized protein n=1 Tax=Rhizophora mucronata TaxID=61149 RepID=A0A2P2PXC5_RHIMU
MCNYYLSSKMRNTNPTCTGIGWR